MKYFWERNKKKIIVIGVEILVVSIFILCLLSRFKGQNTVEHPNTQAAVTEAPTNTQTHTNTPTPVNKPIEKPLDEPAPTEAVSQSVQEPTKRVFTYEMPFTNKEEGMEWLKDTASEAWNSIDERDQQIVYELLDASDEVQERLESLRYMEHQNARATITLEVIDPAHVEENRKSFHGIKIDGASYDCYYDFQAYLDDGTEFALKDDYMFGVAGDQIYYTADLFNTGLFGTQFNNGVWKEEGVYIQSASFDVWPLTSEAIDEIRNISDIEIPKD